MRRLPAQASQVSSPSQVPGLQPATRAVPRRDEDPLEECDEDEDQSPAQGCLPSNPFLISADQVAAWKQQPLEAKQATLVQWVTHVLVEHTAGLRRSRADFSLKKHVLKLIIQKCVPLPPPCGTAPAV